MTHTSKNPQAILQSPIITPVSYIILIFLTFTSRHIAGQPESIQNFILLAIGFIIGFSPSAIYFPAYLFIKLNLVFLIIIALFESRWVTLMQGV